MRWYESACIGCGSGRCGMCSLYDSEVICFSCDDCREEDVVLYEYKGKEICLECLLKEIGAEKIEESDF